MRSACESASPLAATGRRVWFFGCADPLPFQYLVVRHACFMAPTASPSRFAPGALTSALPGCLVVLASLLVVVLVYFVCLVVHLPPLPTAHAHRFDKCYAGAVFMKRDRDGSRAEILCASCHGHLGHVFAGEGLTPTDERHCVNSVSIVYDATAPPEKVREVMLT